MNESTLLGYTGLIVELEHLKIETTLIDEMFAIYLKPEHLLL